MLCRLDTTEERTYKVEERSAENIQIESQGEKKKMENTEESKRHMRHNERASNRCNFKFQKEGRERK